MLALQQRAEAGGIGLAGADQRVEGLGLLVEARGLVGVAQLHLQLHDLVDDVLFQAGCVHARPPSLNALLPASVDHLPAASPTIHPVKPNGLLAGPAQTPRPRRSNGQALRHRTRPGHHLFAQHAHRRARSRCGLRPEGVPPDLPPT